MKCKIYLITVSVVFMFGLIFSRAYAGTFFDDFNDGNADGWWLGYSMANPANYGNWWVENGVLVQQKSGDGYTALLEDMEFSDQIVETELKLVGVACYGGIILWFQDTTHRVNIRVYPGVNKVIVGEVNGSVLNSEYYIIESLSTSTWYKLRVEADSTSGELDVYLDDVYLFTYTAMTPNRIGQTGIFNGNSDAGAYFDNFRLVSNDISPLAVSVDIKPGSEDNCVNINDHGVIPIAILGSADFDVTQIDPATCECSGMTVKMVGKSNKYLASYEDVDLDGFDDLVVKIEDSDAVLDSGEGIATLTCELYDGTQIEGTDYICIVPYNVP